jgi:hypothetical protein
MICFIDLFFKFSLIIYMIYLIVILHKENKMLDKAIKRNLNKDKR